MSMERTLIAEVERDGTTIKVSVPETFAKLWNLGPSSRVLYTISPDGEIVITLHNSLNDLARHTMDVLLPDDGPSASELIESSRAARRVLNS